MVTLGIHTLQLLPMSALIKVSVGLKRVAFRLQECCDSQRKFAALTQEVLLDIKGERHH